MDKVKPWISAFRLRTLPLSVSGIIVGGSFAYYNGFFKFQIFFFAILATISLQILSNLANDYGDGVKGTDNEDRIGPMRAIQSGEITPDEMLIGIRTSVLITIFLIFMVVLSAFGMVNFLYSMLFFILGGLSIYAAIKYTVGSSAYGYKALGDLMVFIFFGLLSVIGSYFLFARQIDHVLILPAFAIGLLSAGVLNLNNMRDIKSDAKSDKITVAVKLGFERAKIYHNILIVTSLILVVGFSILYYRSWTNLLPLFAFIPLIKHLMIVHKTKDQKLLDPQLKVLALTTFALAILIGLGHVFNTF